MNKLIICHVFYRRRSLVYPMILFLISTLILYIFIERSNIDNLNTESTSNLIDPIENQHLCILNNETLHSIERASSQYCKEQIREISCQIERDSEFFPRYLPNFCPLKDGNPGDQVGCYSKEIAQNLTTHNSSRACIDFCLKNSVAYAEFQGSTGFCQCSSTINVLQSCEPKSNDLIVVYRTGFKPFGNHLERNPPKENQTSISIVFFLTVGGRGNLRQIQRLLQSIYSRQHYYLIHVDSRENYLFEQILKFVETSSNVHLIRQRFPTVWGSTTLLDAHLTAFREIFDKLKWNFSFIVNLSETDFPIKPVTVLANFLKMYQSYNFLRTHNRDPFKFLQSQGIFQTFYQCENYMYRIGARPLIENIIYDGGSDWYVLNREFVHYITFGDDPLINGLKKSFKYSLLPCEIFFHTVISNSRFCDSYIRNNFRLVHWNRERGCKCQHKNVVDWCGCSPMVYRMTEKKSLNETIDKPLFFARKFDPTIDEEIIDWIETKISRRNLSSDSFYLQNVYHSDDENNRLNEIFKYLDAFIRTTLIESENRARPCFDRTIYRLIQIHKIYQKSLFQGFLFEYEFAYQYNYEIFLRLNTLQSNRSDLIKRFEVGLEVESKELIFIDRTRTFVEPNMIKVLIEWNSTEIKNNSNLIVRDPNGVVLQEVKLFSAKLMLLVEISLPALSSPSMIGLWNIEIVENQTEQIIGSLNFLLLSKDENRWLNVQYLSILKQFWSLVDICSKGISRSQCDLSFEEKICSEQRWSSSFPVI